MQDNLPAESQASADLPIQARHSLTTHTLLSMGIRITLVVIAVSVLSYWHIVQTLEEQTYDKLDNYIQERGEKESSLFELAQDNHKVFKQHYLNMVEHAPSVTDEEFYAIYEKQADGTLRMRSRFFDGFVDKQGLDHSFNSSYVNKSAPFDNQQFRDRLVYAYRLLDRFGPAWTTRFANLYTVIEENGVQVYWPGFAWGSVAQADLDVHKEEWYYVSNKSNNPGRGPVWTGLYYDTTADDWMVSCETPVDYEGKQLINIGHDYLLNDLVKQVFDDHLDGSYNFIFREDGRLIAHPDKVNELKKAEGLLKIQDIKDEKLRSQYQQVLENIAGTSENSKVFFDQQNDAFMAVAKITGPDWWFVTVFPKDLLSSAARSTAEFIFMLSVISLMLELLMLYLVLRFKVVQPLKMFVDASSDVKEGHYDKVASGLLSLPDQRKDEVGSLARMLRAMAGTIHSNIAALEHLDQLKDDFMANTSHELRTPLNGIVGIAESMLDGAAGDLSEKQGYNLSLIVTSGHRLTHLVDDILDFSKLKHHELTLNRTSVDLHGLAEVVILFSRHSIKKPKLTLLNEVANDIPAVYADENRIQQILYNLIGNAIKFTNDGFIRVTSRVWRDQVTITVSDTGIGIAQDKLESIFESFEQGDGSASREYGGTGLGLTVTKRLVELHEGRVKVVSCEGKGSEFSFTLPIFNEDDKAAQAKETPSVALASDEDLQFKAQASDALTSSLVSEAEVVTPEDEAVDTQTTNGKTIIGRILVVDDEPINIQVLHNHLSINNYAVITASSGKEAIAAVQEQDQFDAVLLDAMMPGMTGYEVCQHIRKIYPANQLPILMVTAKSGINDMMACFESGANDFLTKPVSKTELLERVKTHIAVVRLNHDLNHANVKLKEHAQGLERQVQLRTGELAEHVEELRETNQQLLKATEKVSQSTTDIVMLEELGRGLTSTLELNQVIKSIYRSSNKILDARSFMLGILDAEKNVVHVPLIVEESQKLAAIDYDLSEVNTPAIWCITHQKELLIFEEEDVYNYFDDYMADPKRGKLMSTIVYQPLIIGDKIVGCLSVQHPDEHAYDDEQMDMLRTLASYSAIAIANASGYAKLAETHQALKDTQKQLVLQEKMASLGTLTAGVAHEINNPTNFVHVGAANLQVDLLKFQEFIMELAGDDADKEILDSLEQKFSPLNGHIDTIINGTERIKTIVKDLRSFTHLHSANKKPADIIDCLESTIKLVKSKYIDVTDFFVDFNPLPKLVCYPAQLNQVFLNIIINACDAIEQKQSDQDVSKLGYICVCCKFTGGNISISISDNGCGMSEQTRLKIFEPFYTTKAVGVGTGLGMAISFGIIEDHGGTIIARSVEGVGTLIKVELPFL